MKQKLLVLLLLLHTTVFAQVRPQYNIGILLDGMPPEIEVLLEDLKKEIKAVVGYDADILFPKESILVNNRDLEKGQKNYTTLIENQTDLILAFGIINHQIITQQTVHQKPTILSGAISRDFSSIDFSKKTSGIKNFTYLIESKSFIDDFQVFHTLIGFKKLGIVLEESLVNILPLATIFDKEFERISSDYKILPANNLEDITKQLEGVDAVYIVGDYLLDSNAVKQLAQICIDKKIPSFISSGVENVRNGILATNQADEDLGQFFRRIALNIEAFVGGKTLSELPVWIEYEPRLTVNFNTVQFLGLPMKYSLMGNMDLIGDVNLSSSEEQYNLVELIHKALGQNLSLQAIDTDVKIGDQNIKQAKSEYLPTVTGAAQAVYTDPRLAKISFGQTSEFQTAGNITIQQPIYSEAANANIAIQKSLRKAQGEKLNTEKLNTVFEVANAYFNILILKTNVQIQLRNLSLTRNNLQLAQQNFEEGATGKADLLRFKSEMAQNTQSIVSIVNQLDQSYVELNRLLSNATDADLDIKDIQLDEGVFKAYKYDRFIEILDDEILKESLINFLTEEALKNAPELKELGYNLDAIERRIKLNTVGRFLPTVALQGQYNQVFSRTGEGSVSPVGAALPTNNYNIALNVSVPIFGPNQTNIKRQTTILQKEQLGMNKQNVEINIAANIRKGILEVSTQMSNIELSKVSEETAKETFELTQIAYSNGAVPVIQLLDAQNNYLNAQQVRTNAMYNYLISVLRVERFLGSYFLLNTEEKNTEFSQRFLEYTKNNQ